MYDVRKDDLEQTELSHDRDPQTGQFLKGYRGGPGRQKGSRNKLGEQFIGDLYDDWLEHGMEALEAARKEKPADYLKVIASILPRDIKVSLETMSDKELSIRIDQLTESLGLKLIPVGAESQRDETIEVASNTQKN